MTTEKPPELFPEAEARWDLERLLDDLANVKGESLTMTEQLTLRGLLCGYTPKELAKMRLRGETGQRTNVSRGVRSYVKKLMRAKGVEVPERLNSVKMLAMLKKAGYKKQLSASPDDKIITISTLEKFIRIVVGNEVNNGKSKMNVEIRLLTSLSAEEIVKMLTGSEDEKKKEE